MQTKRELKTQYDSWKGETNEQEKTKNIFYCSMCIIPIYYICVSFLYCRRGNHYCTGEDCPICANIHQAEQTLKNLATAMSAITIVNLMPVLFILLVMGWFLPVFHTSLVSQKVRLND